MFNCDYREYRIGHKVPCKKFQYPLDMTIGIHTYNVGDIFIPAKHFITYGFDIDEWPVTRFVIIRNGRFDSITNKERYIVYPLYDKWGDLISVDGRY